MTSLAEQQTTLDVERSAQTEAERVVAELAQTRPGTERYGELQARYLSLKGSPA